MSQPLAERIVHTRSVQPRCVCGVCDSDIIVLIEHIRMHDRSDLLVRMLQSKDLRPVNDLAVVRILPILHYSVLVHFQMSHGNDMLKHTEITRDQNRRGEGVSVETSRLIEVDFRVRGGQECAAAV